MRIVKRSKRNKTKLKKRNSRKNKRIVKMRGGNKTEFTLMTFNVELFGYLPTYPEKNLITNNNSVKTPDFSKYQELTIDDAKVRKFEELFKDVDIACLQESVIKKPDHKYEEIEKINDYVGTTSSKNEPNYDGVINGLVHVDSCKSHNLTWPRSTAFYGEGSKIANSIYVKTEYSRDQVKSNYYLTRNYGVADATSIPRCFAMTELNINDNKIKVATVHLIGGRFEDERYFLGDQNQRDMLIEEKKHQLKSVIELEADIICGDFNTKLSNSPSLPPTVFSSINNVTPSKETETLPNITDELIKYAKTFYKNDSVPENLEDLVKKWLFMDEYHALLSSYDYNSVYTEYPENETSAYGGVVDFIYYKRDKLSVVGKATIVNSVLGEYVPDVKVSSENEKVKREDLQGLKYVNGLSDHAPVKATFSIKG